MKKFLLHVIAVIHVLLQIYVVALALFVFFWIVAPNFWPVYWGASVMPWLFLPLPIAYALTYVYELPIIKHLINILILSGIVILAPHILPGGTPKPKDYDESQLLRVVSVNIAEGEKDLPALLERINELGADVVCFQEVLYYYPKSIEFRERDQTRMIQQTLKMDGPFEGQFEYEEGTYGLMTVSRFPVVQSRLIELEDGRAQTATIRAGGKDIKIINVHLSASSYWRGECARGLSYFSDKLATARRTQDGQIQYLLVEEIEEKNTVLAGVFTLSEYMHKPYKRLTDVLIDSYNTRGFGIGATYPTGLPLIRIDYIFSTPDLVPVFARSIPTPYSDHAIVVTDLYVPGMRRPVYRRPARPRRNENTADENMTEGTNAAETDIIQPEMQTNQSVNSNEQSSLPYSSTRTNI